MSDDATWMGAALALAERGHGLTYPNPNVGCVIVHDGRVVGRGWTQPGGRPHAEAMALEQAGAAAVGATLYTTLEPCAHRSARGPTCSDLIIRAGVRRVVASLTDPDPRTAGGGFAALRAAGIAVIANLEAEAATRAMAAFLTRQRRARPFITLKLATALDGCIALANGASRWITGDAARRHAHLERARHEAILVGRGTWDADAPALDVRLPGLTQRAPARYVLTSRALESVNSQDGRAVALVRNVEDIFALPHDSLLVEGGAQAAAAFLRADLVDRLLLYTAPILLGGKPALADLGWSTLDEAHGRWRLVDERRLGSDRLQTFERAR